MKKYKLIVLGNQNVGKTTLTYKLCEDEFLHNVEATIGVDLRSYTMNVEGEDIKVNVQCVKAVFMLQGTCITARNMGYRWTRKIPPFPNFRLL